jgi:hypothetical protein
MNKIIKMETTTVVKYNIENVKDCPKHLQKSLWAANRCLFGSRHVLASLEYRYVPAELTVNGNPLFIGWSMSYDGGEKAKKESPDKSWTWDELKTFFPENKFVN